MTQADRRCTWSQQVNWLEVHTFVQPQLLRVGVWPMAGTPEWCALDAADPRKIASLLDAAQHWALRVEACQSAQCEASRDISDALDWSALAREIAQRRCFYVARPWLRRAVRNA